MANGRGGARPGAGRPKKPKLVVDNTAAQKVPAEPKAPAAPVLTASQMQRIIEQSNAAAKAKKRPAADLSPFRPAQFPPQAMPPKKLRMAMDQNLSWAENAWATGNGYPLSYLGAEGLQFFGYPYLSELAQRPEYRIISETIADDATRKWIDFEVTGDEKEKLQKEDNPGFAEQDPDERKAKLAAAGKTDKVKALKDELARLEARDRFYTIAVQDGLFGRSHLYIDLGVDLDNPDDYPELATSVGNGRNDISRRKVAKGSLRALRTIEPIWVYPTTYNAINPLKEDWYNPEIWWVLGKQVHRSRMPVFVSSPVPDLLKPAYSFGGMSRSQMAKPYVDIWLTVRQSIAELIHSFSVMVLLTDQQALLQGGDAAGLLQRVEMFNAFRNNQGTFVLNKATEEFQNVSAPLGGLHELQAQAQEHMASVSRLPLVKLTGISPSGLNACLTGDTLIETDQGEVPIKNVCTGQKVMTRNGWAPIAKAGCTGYATELIEIKTAESMIRCTADHRIWLPSINEFVTAENVRPGQILLSRGAIESQNTANQSHGAAVFGGEQRAAITPLRQITPKANIFSTGKSGEFTTDLFQKAITFIISTKIAQTINSIISNRCRLQIMQRFTALDLIVTKIANVSESAVIAASHLLFSGSRRELCSVAMNAGLLNSEKIDHRKLSRIPSVFASCAAYLLNQSERTQNTVRENAQPRAKIAPRICPNITKNILRSGPDTASVEMKGVVVSVRRVPASEFVYDIQVERGYLPEFFANSICVHNSSEGEIRVYYDTIAAYQNRFFRPHLTRIINFAQLSLFGEIDPELTWNFEPLWEMSDKEIAELQKAEAERDQLYVDVGALSPEEIRKRIVDDPKLPYTSINPEDVPSLREEEIEGLEPAGGRPQPGS